MSEDGANEHSLRGPSGAAAWRRCKGKLNAERGLPDKCSREAAEGTVFHEYAAMCLMFGLDPDDFPHGTIHEQDGWEIEYDDDMRYFMREGLAWAREQMEPGDIVLVERRVSIAPWCGPGEFGTSDLCIIKVRKRKIIQFDWKYGKGVPVSPIKNDQMYLYNLGCWHDYAKRIFKNPRNIEVVFYIEQPRAPGGGGIWETTMEEVLAEGDAIREDALATMDPDAPRTPGTKQCQFCKRSGDCREQQEWLLKMYGQTFDSIQDDIEVGVGPAFDPAEKLSLEARSYILLNWKAFKNYRDRIHELTMLDLAAGREVPLVKAVLGNKGNREYSTDDLEDATDWLVGMLGEDAFKPKELQSPAQVEKMVGKKNFEKHVGKYIVRAKAKPILVPIDDPREPVQDYPSRFDEAFIDEEDEDE